jgi:DNA-binding beta-propeller fold protein YncE
MQWWCCFVVVSGLAACTAGDAELESLARKPAPAKLPQSENPYTLFESLQVRPLALSPSGKFLFAANTPDNRLEIFRVQNDELVEIGSVAVGLEPVAVAARSDSEVWVVNHLSDSVSIVNVSNAGHATVTRTLLVGDEPRDIVFAGTNRNRAFVTTAHRGQNTGDAYDLQTPGVGRADVWVFDANNLGSAPGGARLTKLTLFADTPRALAVSADGHTVYAAAFMSGNQTTVVSDDAVRAVYPQGMPEAQTIEVNGTTYVQPHTGLIVKFRNGHWVDAYGSVFDAYVKIRLPDHDVFAIDATANPPVAVASGVYSHVGTTLFNMAVNPVSGKVYVTNTDAHNDVRFEGHTPGFTSVRGHIADSRITVIDPATGTVTPHDLNPHVDYTTEGSPAEKALSMASPQDVAVSTDGSTLAVVAQGSAKLAIYDTAALEAGNLSPSLGDQVELSGGGPAGVVLDEARGHAYVLTRFDNSISIVDVAQREEVGKVEMFSPEPESVVVGRKYLYDANLTSQHGVTSCASCHIGGDNDALAWDLGNPGGLPLSITKLGNVFAIAPQAITQVLPQFAPVFDYNHPVKGPMTTQSLRGMDNHGAMHWRGDRNGAVHQDGTPFIDPATNQPIVSAQPNAGLFDEVRAFTSFNVAFPGLVGNDAELSDSDMLEFAHFILQVMYPPNPVRNLDNSLTGEQQQGRDFFFNHAANGAELPSDRFHNCNGCHTLDPTANAGATAHPGFFGTDGKLSFELESQIFKVPHLRNMYTKVGMFGSSPNSLEPGTIILQQGPATDQVRGFGFRHDGALGTLEHFFTAQVFIKATEPVNLGGSTVAPNPFGIPFVNLTKLAQGQIEWVDGGGFALRHAIVAFMLAFDSNFAPIVGQQITMTASNATSAGTRLDLFEARANAGECDLVAKSATQIGANAGFLYTNGSWQPASTKQPAVTDAALRARIASQDLPPVTFTCVPVGEGTRIAIDRDGDGYADWDEKTGGTDPADPASHP